MMKTQDQLNEIEVDIDYCDNESIVEGFFKLSCFNRMNEFNFIDAFYHLRSPIDDKLTEHAQGCTLDEFVDYTDLIGLWDNHQFEQFELSTHYIHISTEDAKYAIMEMYYSKSKEAFSGMFDNLIEIQESLNMVIDGDTRANVILFDKVIHAEHVSGDIFEDLDIDSIKEELDKEIIELMDIKI